MMAMIEVRGPAVIGGRRYRDIPDPVRHVGAALEAASFHPGRTARDHLRVHPTAGRVSRSRVGEVLELTGLAAAARRRVGGFSLGMRQRLGLATALLGDPAVLILDEPANGLDPQGIRWLREFLRGLAAGGRTVLVSSRVLGRLITQAPLAELTAQAGTSLKDVFFGLTGTEPEVSR